VRAAGGQAALTIRLCIQYKINKTKFEISIKVISPATASTRGFRRFAVTFKPLGLYGPVSFAH
jgi:hypothetical protein